MKITPTKRQLQYLSDIGALGYSNLHRTETRTVRKKASIKKTPVYEPVNTGFDRSNSSMKSTQNTVFLIGVIMIILVLLVSITMAQNSDSLSTVPFDTTETEFVDKASTEADQLEEIQQPSESMASDYDTLTVFLEGKLNAMQDGLNAKLTAYRTDMSERVGQLNSQNQQFRREMEAMANNQSRLDEMNRNTEERLTQLNKSLAERLVMTHNEIENRISDTEITALQSTLASQGENVRYLQFGILGLTGFLIIAMIAFVVDRVRVRKKITEASSYTKKPELNPEKDTVEAEPEGSMDNNEKPDSELPEIVQELHPEEQKPDEQKLNQISEQRGEKAEVPFCPKEQVKKLNALSEDRVEFLDKPIMPKEAWTIGFATNKGNVRPKNEDYALGFQIGDIDVSIVADGVGGAPLGERASYLASVGAALSIIKEFGKAPKWFKPNPKDVAAKSIMAAEKCLAAEARKRNITSGLQTTLIVVIGTKTEFGYAYVGDGGGYVAKPGSGHISSFLIPQKADGQPSNVISACLGPVMLGAPVTGTLVREAGDIVIIGSDGVFDLYLEDEDKEAYVFNTLHGCIQYEGDLQKLTDDILKEMAAQKDAAGYLADDNLTLAIMGDGTQPSFAADFWKRNRNLKYGGIS